MQEPLKTMQTLPEGIKPSVDSIPESLLDEKPRPSIIQSPDVSFPVSNAAPPPSSPPSSASSSESASIDIQNGKRTESEGFIYITVRGTDEERGYAHGFLLADRIVKFIRTYAFFLWNEYGRDIVFFTKNIKIRI